MKMNYQGNQIMDSADIEKLCADYGVEVEILPYEDFVFQTQVAKSGGQLTPRPPVVTVMGHVDHGKTTLLDTLRKTRVAEKEAGGITQKIGAYKLNTPEGTIVFIDTPGHEAFTNLRARGAKVTDLVILVVAANDGVQPQTVEAIRHAQAAGVPMIVAINKIDIQGADSEKVKQELNKHGILVEAWGGKVVSVDISAKMNKNLDTLLEMIQLTAQMQELKAYADIPARGTIIESRLDPQLGPIGTVLIQHGQLKKGDYFICGNSLGKIKSIFDDSGRMINEARVPDPIEIMGFEDVPQAGDIFQVVDDLEKAKKIIDMRRATQKAAKNKDFLAEKKLSLQNLFTLVEQDKIQTFPVIVKADNFGSAEVLEQILVRLSQDKLKIEVMHSGLGNITEGRHPAGFHLRRGHPRLQRQGAAEDPVHGQDGKSGDPPLQRDLPPGRGHRKGRQGQDRPAVPGDAHRRSGDPAEIQDLQRRPRGRLRGPRRQGHAQVQGQGHARRRPGLRGRDRIPEAHQGRGVRGPRRHRVRHPHQELQQLRDRRHPGSV